MTETSKTANIILVLHWAMDYDSYYIQGPNIALKWFFAVLDVSLIMGLDIGETDKVFFTLIFAVFVEKFPHWHMWHLHTKFHANRTTFSKVMTFHIFSRCCPSAILNFTGCSFRLLRPFWDMYFYNSTKFGFIISFRGKDMTKIST